MQNIDWEQKIPGKLNKTVTFMVNGKTSF